MVTGIIDQQVPAIFILIGLYIPVRQLPEHMIEVFHRTRRDEFFGNVGAALGIRAEAALVLGGDLHADRNILNDAHDILLLVFNNFAA
jgi:hypothetical protein